MGDKSAQPPNPAMTLLRLEVNEVYKVVKHFGHPNNPGNSPVFFLVFPGSLWPLLVSLVGAKEFHLFFCRRGFVETNPPESDHSPESSHQSSKYSLGKSIMHIDIYDISIGMKRIAMYDPYFISV